jgi:hypothetical protein
LEKKEGGEGGPVDENLSHTVTQLNCGTTGVNVIKYRKIFTNPGCGRVVTIHDWIGTKEGKFCPFSGGTEGERREKAGETH